MSEKTRKTILEVSAARAGAFVVRHADGRPMRRILPGARTIPVGMMASRKTGRALWHESPVERVAIMMCEADPAVETFLAQPHRLETIDRDGRPVVYHPDIEATLVGGRTLIVECKGARDRRMGDPRYLRKLEVARRIYAAVGWRFLILQESDILRTPRSKAAALVWRHRNVLVPDEMILRVSGRLAKAPFERSEAIDLLGGSVLGEARLDALAVRRICTWDRFLERRRDSVVRRPTSNEESLL
jgi:hypothetical protein